MSLDSPSSSPLPLLKDDFKEAYRQHASTLRSWYIGFGIGVPVLFLSNDLLWEKIVASRRFEHIGLAFFLGVAFQVLLALLDKYASWMCYYEGMTGHPKPLHNEAKWWMEHDFPSIFLDIGTLFLFGVATYLTFAVVKS